MTIKLYKLKFAPRNVAFFSTQHLSLTYLNIISTFSGTLEWLVVANECCVCAISQFHISGFMLVA